MSKKILTCPNCQTEIDPDTPVHVVRKGLPRFKSYVAPINMALISLLMFLIDFGVHIESDEDGIWWSIFVIIGLWMLYFMGVGLKFRVEQAWLILPAFFFLLSILIASIDILTRDNDADVILFNLSWSFYAIIVILIILVILPIITFTGKQARPPLEVLKEIIELESSHQGE